jgi:hypothetical protein
MFTKRFVAAALAGVFALGTAGSAMAETQWQKDHPRRAEVNHRLNHQNKRIHNKVAQGKMTKGQAAALHRQDHQVRQEERDMASQDGGHITKQEQRTLNQQENQVSREIHNE